MSRDAERPALAAARAWLRAQGVATATNDEDAPSSIETSLTRAFEEYAAGRLAAQLAAERRETLKSVLAVVADEAATHGRDLRRLCDAIAALGSGEPTEGGSEP